MRSKTKPMIRAAVAHSGDILLKRKGAGKPNKNPIPPEKGENLENVPSEEISNYLRDVIVSRLNDLLGETLKSIFELPRLYTELGIALKARGEQVWV